MLEVDMKVKRELGGEGEDGRIVWDGNRIERL